MLLICQPKSASTSLLEGLKEVSNLPGEQVLDDRIKIYERPSEWKTFHHQDGRVIPKKMLVHWQNTRNKIYKQHVLPIPCHVKHIDKMVLLTRDPKESVESYIRTGWKPKNQKEKEEQINLLTKWNKMWNAEKENVRDVFHVTYEQVTLSPSKTLEDIAKFFNMRVDIPNEYELPKERYTR